MVPVPPPGWGVAYGQATVVEALKKATVVTNGLIALFRTRHDPSQSDDRKAAEKEARAAIEDGLAVVEAIDEDRILRLYRTVVLATLRTNAFIPVGEEALAFKFDSSAIPILPAPVPLARDLGLFAAGSKASICAADRSPAAACAGRTRRDDFRTEVLGLMKAQVVKNAV